MALPTSRTEFAKYCLRKLGAPVIKINVDDDQVNDRIDEALLFWYDYHFDGSEKTYYKHQLTQQDFDNKYIILPDNIIGAVKIFEHGFASSNIANPYNLQYQAYFSDLIRGVSSGGLISYYIAYQNLQFMEQILVGLVPIRFNRHSHQLHLDMDWTRFGVGDYVLVEAWQVIDPDVYTDAWSDRLLMRYATALIKRQWGENLKKYDGMEMPGGTTFNGQKIYDEAQDEIADLEQQIIDSSMPPMDFIG